MIYWTLISSIIAALAGLVVYIYYLKRGQFDDPEAAKYQLFHEEEEN